MGRDSAPTAVSSLTTSGPGAPRRPAARPPLPGRERRRTRRRASRLPPVTSSPRSRRCAARRRAHHAGELPGHGRRWPRPPGAPPLHQPGPLDPAAEPLRRLPPAVMSFARDRGPTRHRHGVAGEACVAGPHGAYATARLQARARAHSYRPAWNAIAGASLLLSTDAGARRGAICAGGHLALVQWDSQRPVSPYGCDSRDVRRRRLQPADRGVRQLTAAAIPAGGWRWCRTRRERHGRLLAVTPVVHLPRSRLIQSHPVSRHAVIGSAVRHRGFGCRIGGR
jgi:hypothetical protein